MAQGSDRKGVEHEIENLKASIEKYLTGETHLSSEVAADLARAIHDLGEQLVNLHRRIETIEDTHDEWTTRGWEPPPGRDHPS
jgi:plasmid maintenance system antidote protein VapI